jgi:hypothetical protein
MHKHSIHVQRVDSPCTADYDCQDTHSAPCMHLHKLYSKTRSYYQPGSTSGEIHTNSTSSDFSSFLETSAWSMSAVSLLPTHHEIFIIRLTFRCDEECGRLECGGRCSYFWHGGDMVGHWRPVYYARFRIRVHGLAMTDPAQRQHTARGGKRTL